MLQNTWSKMEANKSHDALCAGLLKTAELLSADVQWHVEARVDTGPRKSAHYVDVLSDTAREKSLRDRDAAAMKRIYTYLAARLVRAIVAWCTARKRYVDYVHSTGNHIVTVDVSPEGMRARANSVPETRVYMRRYVILGHLTGDSNATAVREGFALRLRMWWANLPHAIRARLPNLYLHHMHAPDADECLHDHPWPWGLSLVLLGGYTEERLRTDPEGWFGVHKHVRTHNAPAFNYISGQTFHRVAALDTRCAYCVTLGRIKPGCPINNRFEPSLAGTFTLFLAGPRRRNKPWGYLVPGRGYVNQQERHAELGASEVRPSA